MEIITEMPRETIIKFQFVQFITAEGSREKIRFSPGRGKIPAYTWTCSTRELYISVVASASTISGNSPFQ